MAPTRWLAVLLACASFGCKRHPVDPHADAASPSTPVVTVTPVAAHHADGLEHFVATVELRADGTTWFNGVLMGDDEALQSAARAASREQPRVEAQIIAAPSVPYARVIGAMDLLRMAGIRDVAFGSVGPPPPEPVARDR